jgi:hypothetical protein
VVLTCYYEQLILPFSDVNVRNYTVGGSVLINLKDNEYILVCENIFYFNTLFKIKRFMSFSQHYHSYDMNILAYALDGKNNYYILQDELTITINSHYNNEALRVQLEQNEK